MESEDLLLGFIQAFASDFSLKGQQCPVCMAHGPTVNTENEFSHITVDTQGFNPRLVAVTALGVDSRMPHLPSHYIPAIHKSGISMTQKSHSCSETDSKVTTVELLD